MSRFQTILITGAAGEIGTVLRAALRPRCTLLRSLDIRPLTPAADHEECVVADLRDPDAVARAMAGVDIVYHFGGLPLEDSWENIRDINIDGTYVVYEQARIAGVKRIVFASSNHAMGFHRRTTTLVQDEPTRPDSRYGVAKVFGEALGRLYADKHGIETINLRIGQFRPRPTNRRMLSLWLSPADMGRLAVNCLEAEDIHFETVYAISANKRPWYADSAVRRIGYDPQDCAEDYAAGLDAAAMAEDAVEAEFHGGPFCSAEFDGSLDRID